VRARSAHTGTASATWLTHSSYTCRPQRWREDLCGLLRQAREDGDVTVTTPDDVLTEQLLAMAMGLQLLALLPRTPTAAAQQTAMLDAFLAGLQTD
jgi:hypothetical protein